MRRPTAFQAGFTLVELLVTVGIIVLILAAVTISGSQTNAGHRLSTAAEAVRQGLYRARSLALAPAVDKASDTTGYCFSLTGSPGGPYTGFRITEVKNLTAACSLPAPMIDQESFPSDITVTLAGATAPDVIYAIDGYARITQPDPASANNLSIQLTQPQVSKPITVQLTTATGQVEICRGGTCQ